MIPSFNHSHVLPPYTGDSPTQVANNSPFETVPLELVGRLGSSPARRALLSGLFRYRAALRALGFVNGFQWLDGSFVEDVEKSQGRDPGDIDVVTFARTPAGMSQTEVASLLTSHPNVFDQELTKEEYGCDAIVVRLDGTPEKLVRRAAYYFGLFSHRRSDNVWKGMLAMPLDADDATAVQRLNEMEAEHANAAAA